MLQQTELSTNTQMGLAAIASELVEFQRLQDAERAARLEQMQAEVLDGLSGRASNGFI